MSGHYLVGKVFSYLTPTKTHSPTFHILINIFRKSAAGDRTDFREVFRPQLKTHSQTKAGRMQTYRSAIKHHISRQPNNSSEACDGHEHLPCVLQLKRPQSQVIPHGLEPRHQRRYCTNDWIICLSPALESSAPRRCVHGRLGMFHAESENN